jgi:hypothetical protein
MCKADSGWVWHSWQIGLDWPPCLIMRSVVHNLFCRINHMKNLHLGSTFADHRLPIVVYEGTAELGEVSWLRWVCATRGESSPDVICLLSQLDLAQLAAEDDELSEFVDSWQPLKSLHPHSSFYCCHHRAIFSPCQPKRQGSYVFWRCPVQPPVMPKACGLPVAQGSGRTSSK